MYETVVVCDHAEKLVGGEGSSVVERNISHSYVAAAGWWVRAWNRASWTGYGNTRDVELQGGRLVLLGGQGDIAEVGRRPNTAPYPPADSGV